MTLTKHFLIASITVAFLPLRAGAATIEALEMDQTHTMAGPQKTILTRKALRLEQKNSGVVILCNEPFTHATVINPKKKVFIIMPIEKAVKQMKGLTLLLNTTSEFTEQDWKGPKDDKILRMPALLYQKNTPGKSWCKFWVLKEPKMPPVVVSLICTYSGGLCDDYGVPLKHQQFVTKKDSFNEIDRDAPPEVATFFETKSIKKVKVPESTFSVPLDFRKAKDNSEVMTNSVGFGSYKEMIQSPDFLFQSSSDKLIDKEVERKREASPPVKKNKKKNR